MAEQTPLDALTEWFSLKGKVAVVTGAAGAIGNVTTRGLARAGAAIVLLDRDTERAKAFEAELREQGHDALAIHADVLDRDELLSDREAALAHYGHIDILVNVAGGNVPGATVPDDKSVFDISMDAVHQALELNWTGTVLPTLVFGETMVKQGEGVIINISSMAARRTLTRVVAYSSAKAAIDNFTRWMAVELSRKFGPGLRVNAIAPGFFIGNQNRALLLNPDGSLTQRGQTVIAHTPAGRFGEAEELISTLIWLCAPASRFVNGVVVPVDGGFDAFSGV